MKKNNIYAHNNRKIFMYVGVDMFSFLYTYIDLT